LGSIDAHQVLSCGAR